MSGNQNLDLAKETKNSNLKVEGNTTKIIAYT